MRIFIILLSLIFLLSLCFSQIDTEEGEVSEPDTSSHIKYYYEPLETQFAVRGSNNSIIIFLAESISEGEPSGSYSLIKVSVDAWLEMGTRVEELKVGDYVIALSFSIPNYQLNPDRDYLLLTSDDFTYDDRPLDMPFFVLERPKCDGVDVKNDKTFEFSFNTLIDDTTAIVRKNGEVIKRYEDYNLSVIDVGLPPGTGGELELQLELLDLPRAKDIYTLEVEDANGNLITTDLKGYWGEYREDSEDRLIFASEIAVSKQKDQDTAFYLDILGRYELGSGILRYFPIGSVKTASTIFGNPNSLNFGFGVKYILGMSTNSYLFTEGIFKLESDDHYKQVNSIGDITATFYHTRLNTSSGNFSMILKPKGGVEMGTKMKRLEGDEGSKVIFRPKVEAEMKFKYKLRPDFALIFKGDGALRYIATDEIYTPEETEGEVILQQEENQDKMKYYVKGKVGVEFFNSYVLGFNLEWGSLPPTYNFVRKYGISYSVEF